MSDVQRAVTRLVMWVSTTLICAVTRLPADGLVWTIVFLLAASAVVVLAALATSWSKAPSLLRGWLLLVSLGMFLVPPSAGAVAPWIPAWTAAGLYAVTLHLFFQDDSRRAPVVRDPAATRKASQVVRYLPVAAAVAVLVIAPLVLALMPLRIRSVFELQTAFAPVLPLLLVGGALLVGGSMRAVMDRRADPAPAAVPAKRSRAEIRKAARKEVDAT